MSFIDSQKLVPINEIKDPASVRIFLYQRGNISHASLAAVLKQFTDKLTQLEKRVEILEKGQK